MRITAISTDDILQMLYLDSHGMTSIHVVRYHETYWGYSEWYPAPGWFLKCEDLKSKTKKSFRIENIIGEPIKLDGLRNVGDQLAPPHDCEFKPLSAIRLGSPMRGHIFRDTLTSGKRPFADGSLITTSAVIVIKDKLVLTHSGTRYLLVTQ